MHTYQISKNINLHHIAKSGQCFRMNEYHSVSGQRYYDIFSRDKFIRAFEFEDHYTFDCEESDVASWINYFDLNTDYRPFFDKINASEDHFLQSALQFGKGMRILNQDYWEALVSFIISQNNNIPRIKKIIEALCLKFGKQIIYNTEVHHAFPTKEDLANVALEDLADIGLGYRDAYIVNLCSLDWDQLKADRETLLKVKGIGPKVASCVLLYGAHDLDEYPVDTWMQRILDEVYGGDFDGSPYQGFLGFVQLLEFYYYRHLNGKLI